MTQFTNRMIAYELDEEGNLDLTKLNVDVVQMLEKKQKPKLYEDLTDPDQYDEINVRTILLMIIALLLIIMIVLSICIHKVRKMNLTLVRSTTRTRHLSKVHPFNDQDTVMQQNDKTAPPKEGEILESETSNVGYLQTTEMVDLTNQGVV